MPDRNGECGTRLRIDGVEDRPHMIHQGVPIAEQDIGHALLLGDFPHTLLVVQIGRVLWKPENPDVLTDLRMSQKSHGLLRRMDRPVVQSQDDALSSFPSS